MFGWRRVFTLVKECIRPGVEDRRDVVHKVHVTFRVDRA